MSASAILRRAAPCLALAFAPACTVGSTPNGARDATAADSNAPLQARLVCMSPSSFRADDAAVHPVVSKPIELRVGPTGPILIDGTFVAVNHWTSPRGDHFLTWYPAGDIAVETVVAQDRRSGVRVSYVTQPNGGAAYVLDRLADGTTRVRGTPFDVARCVDEATVAASATNAFPMIDARVVSSETLPELAELRVTACSRGGENGNYEPTSFDGDHWLWMPSGFFLRKDRLDVAYVAFGPTRGSGAWHLFEIRVDPAKNGAFSFALGEVGIGGVVAWKKNEKPLVRMFGTVSWRKAPLLWCRYEHES